MPYKLSGIALCVWIPRTPSTGDPPCAVSNEYVVVTSGCQAKLSCEARVSDAIHSPVGLRQAVIHTQNESTDFIR